MKIWLERRRFRMLAGKPERVRPPRQRRLNPLARVRARRSVRRAAALPRPSKPSALTRYRARREVRSSQPKWATRAPKPKIPLGDRISSAMYRPAKMKVDRPHLRERMAARASMRVEGMKGPRRAPVFRGRTDKVIAGVVAGSLMFVVLTWLVSRAPAPAEQAQPSLVLAPQAPAEDVALDEFVPLTAPPKSEDPTPKPSTTTTTATAPVYVPPTTTAPPPPPTTTSPTPKPTTPKPTTSSSPTPSPTSEPSCFPDQEPRCPTATVTTAASPAAVAGVSPGGRGGPLGATLLLLLVAAALARLRSHAV